MLPSYVAFDALAWAKFGPVRLQLNAYNLTNKRYIIAGHGTSPILNLPGTPRSVIGTARFSYCFHPKQRTRAPVTGWAVSSTAGKGTVPTPAIDNREAVVGTASASTIASRLSPGSIRSVRAGVRPAAAAAPDN